MTTLILGILWLVATIVFAVIVYKYRKAYKDLSRDYKQLKANYDIVDQREFELRKQCMFIIGDLETCREKLDAYEDTSGKAYIELADDGDAILVCRCSPRGHRIPIKKFTCEHGNYDDFEYKHVCAEELVEILNDEP